MLPKNLPLRLADSRNRQKLFKLSETTFPLPEVHDPFRQNRADARKRFQLLRRRGAAGFFFR
jgi:hypothetical protein